MSLDPSDYMTIEQADILPPPVTLFYATKKGGTFCPPFSADHLCDQRAPGGLGGRQRAAIFAAGFFDMAGPAKRLQPVRVDRVL